MTEEDTGDDEMETDVEKTEEPGNLRLSMGNEVKECESLVLLGEVSLENSSFFLLNDGSSAKAFMLG